MTVWRFIFVAFCACLFLSFSGEKRAHPYTFPQHRFFPPMPVSKENPVTVEGVELGRFLFYDSILSRDFNFSCATCHKQEYAFSSGPEKLTKGNRGALMKRNTLPLFNLAWYSAMFWDGRAATVEDQVFHPVREHDEMNLDWKTAEKRISKSAFYKKMFKAAFGKKRIDSVLIAKAIAQFERTLISYRSKYDRVVLGYTYLDSVEHKGLVLVNDMTKGDCLHCHTSDGDALGTTGKFSNNGLDAVANISAFKDAGRGGISLNKKEMGAFKIPSFRNLVFTAPYMHDGRFASLEEVLDFYGSGVKNSPFIDTKMGFAHQGGNRLSKEEKKQIIAFLKTMSDSAFVHDTAFANPFLKR